MVPQETCSKNENMGTYRGVSDPEMGVIRRPPTRRVGQSGIELALCAATALSAPNFPLRLGQHRTNEKKLLVALLRPARTAARP